MSCPSTNHQDFKTSNQKHQFLNNNNLTTVRLGKNKPTSSLYPSIRATSPFQPNKKQAAAPADATKEDCQSNSSRSPKTLVSDGSVPTNEVLDLPNYKNKNQTPPIIHHLVKKKTRCTSADQSLCSSETHLFKDSMGVAFGNKKSCCRRPLDKNARLERWKILFEAVAAGHGVVVTTNTDRPTSAAVNIGKDGDLNDESDLSQNQSKF